MNNAAIPTNESIEKLRKPAELAIKHCNSKAMFESALVIHDLFDACERLTGHVAELERRVVNLQTMLDEIRAQPTAAWRWSEYDPVSGFKYRYAEARPDWATKAEPLIRLPELTG